MTNRRWQLLVVALLIGLATARAANAAITAKEVENAIKNAIKYLKKTQNPNGSWDDFQGGETKTGVTSLVTLSLLTAGEPINSPTIVKALDYLRNFSPEDLKSTYAVSLQTMVFAAAQPERDTLRVAADVAWLERAQIRPGDRVNWPGSWSYTEFKEKNGDGSNTQYALLALNAAAEVGVPVRPEVWTLARAYWENSQHRDGSWSYTPADNNSTASMTVAGVSSLIITGLKRFQGQEFLSGAKIENCGKGGFNPKLIGGIDWLSRNFYVGQNFGSEQVWRYYYLYGLERAGRLTGQRYFGQHDWYREGAEKLVHEQDELDGSWKRGTGFEHNPDVSTSFALLFLAKGRSPVLINKLRHGPSGDWNNDTDDIRNLVNLVSRDWKNLVTWQVVDPNVATVRDLMQAPILFFNGHAAPEFSLEGKKALRDYVEQGGFIFADACCGRAEFDKGFHALMAEIFPEPEYKLHPLSEDHAVWRARHLLRPDIHPLWGIEHGCRTVVIYSPEDLSCYWNQSETSSSNPAVIKAQRVGQNVVDYATGREVADKLVVREVRDFRVEVPKRGALQIAKIRHGGDWNVAPLAVPNLMTSLRNHLGYDVVINHREMLPRDPNLVNFPLAYIHGRAVLTFAKEDVEALRRHLTPGGGLLFADAACGSPAFDTSFRAFIKELIPDSPLIPIPRDDEIYTRKLGYDLSDVQYNKSAGGGKNYPELEGVKINGRWAVIYSKNDIGCALERHQGLDCKGYTPESALRIASNIVIFSTLP